MDSNALMTMTEAKMLQRVEMARFPQDLTVADKKLLAQVAITYGFDPLMGEVTVYQGRPFVSIDGRYRKAQETGQLDGVETRPATDQERKDWQTPEGDYFYRSEVWVKGSSRPFVAWGRVYKSETVGGKGFKPVEKNPQRMAEKRAEAQALRKAFHIPLPSIEDIGSPDYDIESTAVDATTGELMEGKAEKSQPKAKPEPIQEATESKPSVAKEQGDIIPPTDGIKFEDIKTQMVDAHFPDKTAVSWLRSKANYRGLDFTGDFSDVLKRMSKEQLDFFLKELEERAKMV